MTVGVEAKVCENCGEWYYRRDLALCTHSYWESRRFCSNACRRGQPNRTSLDKLTAVGKICTRCGADKPLDDYAPHGEGAGGWQSRCRTCCAELRKAARAHDRVTLTPEEYTAKRRREVLLRSCTTPEQFDADCARQDGCCATCGEERVLVPDHDHARKKYRAPLCSLCNSALGFVGENATTLRALAAYIERHQMDAEQTATVLSMRKEA